MDFNKLKTFILFAENRSVTQTAKILYRTQSAISHQLKELEKDLGFPLYFKSKKDIRLTYRGNKIYEAPRQIIRSISKNLVEMKRSKEKGLCCGAGGAQIFKESENGSAEINIERINEVESSTAETVVSACPFCLTMINDGIKEKELDSKIKVKDIIEFLEENMNH